MIRYVLVAGTGGAGRPHDFDAADSQFQQTLRAAGAEPAVPQFPFIWDGDVDGISGHNYVWLAGGVNLKYYCIPPLAPETGIPKEQLLVIAFSHGVQVALYAFACGLKGSLISVCPPIRHDMTPIIEQAQPNLHYWLNLYGNWRDFWAIAGGLFDWDWRFRRSYPDGVCSRQELVPGGHGAALRDPQWAGKWAGWIQEVMPKGMGI